ncbi:MAG: hypothetical protein GXP10_06760 [Gammaproteobacteria bacterium]|nr:hypothetical protein [Gammaproteobacteria bacterium]
MANIPLNDIASGMVLADDVADRNGRVLLRSGAEITEKHIRIMKTWGVVEANIADISKEDVEEKSTAQLDPELLKAAEQEAQEFFRHTDLEHEVIHELHRQWILRYASRSQQPTEQRQ